MVRLVIGIVMASFVWANNAAQQAGILPPLNERFSWSAGRPKSMLELPEELEKLPEEPEIPDNAFSKLKANEIKRAACRLQIKKIMENSSDAELCEEQLARDGKLMEESVRLFNEYKKIKGIESPARGAVSESLEKKIAAYRKKIEKAQIKLADAEHTLHTGKRNANKIDSQEQEKEYDTLTELFDELNELRIQAPKVWGLHDKLHEQNITEVYLQAFKHYMILDARFNELQARILKCF